jgi:hypothetical protein
MGMCVFLLGRPYKPVIRLCLFDCKSKKLNFFQSTMVQCPYLTLSLSF